MLTNYQRARPQLEEIIESTKRLRKYAQIINNELKIENE